MTSTQLAILMPVLLLWLMLIVQYGLWFHAKQVASAAAAEAVDAAQVPGGTAGEGEQAARSFLSQSGNLDRIDVSVQRGAGTVNVEITGEAPQFVPGFSWSVTTTAASPVERFVAQPER